MGAITCSPATCMTASRRPRRARCRCRACSRNRADDESGAFGPNYRRHAEETGAKIPEQPVGLAKGPEHGTAYRRADRDSQHLASEQVDSSGELAVVIGKTCKNAARRTPSTTCSATPAPRRQRARLADQAGRQQWSAARPSIRSCPSARPWSPPRNPRPECAADPTRLNGGVVQDSNTSDMIFDVREIIAFLSGSTTLLPGTVILTGTPQGWAWPHARRAG